MDAFCDGGLWEGTVNAVHQGDRYTISFSDSLMETSVYKASEVRLHRDWKLGKWVLGTDEKEVDENQVIDEGERADNDGDEDEEGAADDEEGGDADEEEGAYADDEEGAGADDLGELVVDYFNPFDQISDDDDEESSDDDEE